MSSPPLKTRERLSEVRYEIRGELARRARELEAQGRSLIKLNIGNPGAFGFRAPEHLQRAIVDHIHDTDETQDVLLVPGSSFNVPYRNHFRVTLLPEPAALREVFARIERVLQRRVDSRPVDLAARRAAVA